MKNDATLFMRADQVEAAWRLLMPVFEVWAVAPPSDFPKGAIHFAQVTTISCGRIGRQGLPSCGCWGRF